MKSFTTLLFLISIEATYAQLFIPNLPVEGTSNSYTGDVGIGTSVPKGRLHLHKNVNDLYTTVDLILSQFNGYSKIAGLYAGTYKGGITFSTNNYTAGENDNNILFQERMRLTAEGNLGIGTPGPRGILHLSKSSNDFAVTTDLVISQFNGYSKIAGLYTGTFRGGITFSTNNQSAGENDNNIIYHERMRLTAEGNLGIGTTNPRGALHLSKSSNDFTVTTDLVMSQFNGYSKISGLYTGTFKGGITFSTNNYTAGEDVSNIIYHERMRLTAEGDLGIGTTLPDARLTVKGTVHANEVKVDLNVPGPDYVFEPTYTLPSLDFVQSYINQNKHLPEIPSAKEMEANGVNLGEMNMLLLKKVEELTLYTIEMNKTVRQLLRENEEHSRENALQQKEIAELKTRKKWRR